MTDRTQLHEGLAAGMRMPLCCGMKQDGSFYSFEEQLGRPALLILGGCLPPTETAPLVRGLEHRFADFAALGADILLIVDGQSPYVLDYQTWHPSGPQIVFSLGGFFDRCQFGNTRPSVIVMDRNQRIAMSIDPDRTSAPAADALAGIATLPTEPPREIVSPAPVLMIPGVMDQDFCQRLIDHFEHSSHTAGGMAAVDRSGNAVFKVDVEKKRREDCIVSPDEVLHAEIVERLSRACLPEMKKAFQFDACYTDRILIARYDETGGYFRRHRDNVAAAVAFRQFAISVNLNTGEFEGGYLTFPEYNGHSYRPGPGSGIVFSASLLHEATPVTKGSRYVLLTFFHNAEAQARRIASLAAA